MLAVELELELELEVAIFLIIQPAVAWPDHTARLRPSPKLEKFLFDSLQHRLGGKTSTECATRIYFCSEPE